MRQKYLDEGKIILRGTAVCLPSGQQVYYSQGRECQKVQVDQAIKDTKQSNVFRELISEEDLAATPIEEVEAYLSALKERKRVQDLIHQMRYALYKESEGEGKGLYAANIQTRSQQARNLNSESEQ